jgi:hypothetical protein
MPTRKSQPITPTKTKMVGQLLRIGGMDTQIVQMMDFLDTSDPDLQRIMVLSFKKARLSDADDNEIFTGQVIVRILTAISPAALSIVSRLLHPFEGYFVMNVQGTYGTPADYVEVTAEFVHATNLQPNTKKHGKSRSHLLSLDHPTSLRSATTAKDVSP